MTLKTIKISKIFRNTSSKEGKDYVDKKGNKFTRVTIVTSKDGKEYSLSGIDYKGDMEHLQANDDVELDVTRNGDWLNFRLPSKLDLLEKRIEAIEAQLQGRTQTAAPKIDSKTSRQTHETPLSGELPLSDTETLKDEDLSDFLN